MASRDLFLDKFLVEFMKHILSEVVDVVGFQIAFFVGVVVLTALRLIDAYIKRFDSLVSRVMELAHRMLKLHNYI